MTITVLATPSKIVDPERKRRDPLRPIDFDMATPQVQARGAAAADGNGRGKGRRTSSRLSLNSSNNKQGQVEDVGEQANGKVTENKKRKAGSFHEDVDGFQFTRITNKKPRASIEAVPESPADSAAPSHNHVSLPKKGRQSKKRVQEEHPTTESSTAKTDGPTARTRSTTEAPNRKRDHHSPPAESLAVVDKSRKKSRAAKVQEEERNGFKSPDPQQTGTTKVALPSSDTPVNKRNKEMREGKSAKAPKRRSSLGMRGRRASSLIDSGASNALPHKEVDTAEFYKHIASDGLSEPRRMRQLLIWCGTRALGERVPGSRPEEESARLAARAIQDELLTDFANKSELSDWFGREETDPPAVVVKKPNPKNVQNAGKIKELEEQIQRLQRERHALNGLLKPPSIPRIKPPSASQGPDTSVSEQPSRSKSASTQPSSIDKNLLDPSQQALVALLEPPTKRRTDLKQEPPSASTQLPPFPPSAVSSRLSRVRADLTPDIDALAAGIHDIELYRSTADSLSSRVLGICAQRLEERDARNALRRLAIEGKETADDKSVEPLDRRQVVREDLGVVLGALSRVERR